jgi:hypothetical protein
MLLLSRSFFGESKPRHKKAMSVEQTNVIDIISIDPQGRVVLTISDHLDWSDSTEHQKILQEKLNRYLAFVESGEIMESYPNARDRSIAFRVVFKFAPDQSACSFLIRVESVVRSAGFDWCQEVFGTGGE